MSDNSLIFLTEFPEKVLMPVVRALGEFFFSPLSDNFVKILYSLFPPGQAPEIIDIIANATVIDMIIGFGLPTILVFSIIKWVIGIIM